MEVIISVETLYCMWFLHFKDVLATRQLDERSTSLRGTPSSCIVVHMMWWQRHTSYMSPICFWLENTTISRMCCGAGNQVISTTCCRQLATSGIRLNNISGITKANVI